MLLAAPCGHDLSSTNSCRQNLAWPHDGCSRGACGHCAAHCEGRVSGCRFPWQHITLTRKHIQGARRSLRCKWQRRRENGLGRWKAARSASARERAEDFEQRKKKPRAMQSGRYGGWRMSAVMTLREVDEEIAKMEQTARKVELT